MRKKDKKIWAITIISIILVGGLLSLGFYLVKNKNIIPTTPETPTNPNTPETPEVPETPVTPTNPTNPTFPENPTNPTIETYDCYQESTNQSSSLDGNCGLNYGGSYSFMSTGTGINQGWYSNHLAVIDGDWDSYNFCSYSGDCGVYPTYLFPSKKVISAKWKVKTSSETIIKDIPNDCLVNNQLKLYFNPTQFGFHTFGRCYNGNTWIDVFDSGQFMYEEAIIWRIQK